MTAMILGYDGVAVEGFGGGGGSGAWREEDGVTVARSDALVEVVKAWICNEGFNRLCETLRLSAMRLW